MIDEGKLCELRNKVRGLMGEKRFRHTLGVEKMAKFLAEILLPLDVMDIRAAALLHDVAKEIPTEEQLRLANECEGLTDEDKATLPALHSFAAVTLIKRDFSEFASDKILSAVFKHTLGGEDMSLFDEIIFISDFIEEGRTYPSCTETREILLSEICSSCDLKEKIKALHRSVVLCIEFTISFLKQRGMRINSRTIKTKNAFLGLI